MAEYHSVIGQYQQKFIGLGGRTENESCLVVSARCRGNHLDNQGDLSRNGEEKGGRYGVKK